MGSEGLQDRYNKSNEYEDSLKAFRDWYSTMKTATDKGVRIGFEQGEKVGLEKGEKIGLEKGEKNATYNIARQMKQDGAPMDMIIKYTGLTEEEIDRL